MMKWLLVGLLVVFLLLGSFLLTPPSPIDSKAWDAPSPPAMTGVLAPNERLRLADLLARGEVYGPEDTTIGLMVCSTPVPRMDGLFVFTLMVRWNTGWKPVAGRLDLCLTATAI